MRLFIRNTILFSIIIIAVFGSVLGVKYYITRNISFKESPEIHYLFIGASHPWHAIDERMMQTAVNSSSTSERYMFAYLRLREILDDNPQIDTVFIQCSSTDIWQHTDDKYYRDKEMSKFIPLYYPLFGKDEWKVYFSHLEEVIQLLLQKSFHRSQLDPKFIKKQMGNQAEDENNLQVMDVATVKQDIQNGVEGNSINFSYLRKIIDLCNEKGIKLYGIYYPVYKPEYYYDQRFYYQTLKEKFPDMEVLDYSHWNVPDSARFDAHHLNKYGARLFTDEIKNRFQIQ